MKKLCVFLSFILLFLSWCSVLNNSESNNLNNINKEEIQNPLVDQIGGENNIYTIFFDDNNLSKTFTIYHKWWQKDIVYFINDWYKNLNLKIKFIDNKLKNYRLSNIIMPDGQQDWPFNRELDYKLTQNWGYQLFFGESLMQWDQWTGNVEVSLSVSK